MAFTPKNWEDAPSEVSPISAAALEDLEIRLATYADSIAGTDSNAVSKSMYSEYGGILKGGLTPGDPQELPLGTAGQVLTVVPLAGAVWATPASSGSGLPVFNVLDYGADRTGNSNTVTEINNCLAAAAGNGIAFFPEGVYRIDSSSMQIPSNSKVVGAGIGQSIIRAGPSFGNTAMVRRPVTVNFVTNVLIDGIEFDGNKANRAEFVVENASALVSLSGLNESTRSSNIQIRDSAVNDSHGLAWGIRWADHVTVMGCTIANNQRDGIMHAACHKVAVVGNHVYGNGDDHISMHSEPAATLSVGIRCYDLAITGNVIGLHGTHHGSNGICVSGVQNCAIVGNSVRGGYISGIAVLNNNFAPVEGLAIVGNALHDSGSSADTPVEGYTPSGNRGEGIVFNVAAYVGSGYYGLYGTAPITDVTVAGNTIRGPFRHGIHLEGEAATTTPAPAYPAQPVAHMVITGNQLVGSGSTDDGIGLYLEKYVNDVVVGNNQIRDFPGPGVQLGTAGLSRIYMNGGQVNSCCRDTGGAAIRFGAAADVSLQNMRVLDTQGTPTQDQALDYGTATNAWVHGNNFRGCSASDTITGAKSGWQSMNIGRDGTLYTGDAGTPGLLP